MSSENEDTALIAKHVEQLGEHFDSVVIFCTRHEPETEHGTIQVNDGSGNWFARIGQVREWLIRQDERTRETVRKEE